MHASRVLAIVEDIVENTGNPDKIRSLMQDLGRNHHQQVTTQSGTLQSGANKLLPKNL